ncbi:hypothetical protein [Streptomyces sp. NPDC003863]
MTYTSDTYGYVLLTVRRTGEELTTPVNDLYAVDALLEGSGFDPICSAP